MFTNIERLPTQPPDWPVPKNSVATIEMRARQRHFLQLLTTRGICTRKEAYIVGKTINADTRSVGQMLRHLDSLGAIRLQKGGMNFTIN